RRRTQPSCPRGWREDGGPRDCAGKARGSPIAGWQGGDRAGTILGPRRGGVPEAPQEGSVQSEPSPPALVACCRRPTPAPNCTEDGAGAHREPCASCSSVSRSCCACTNSRITPAYGDKSSNALREASSSPWPSLPSSSAVVTACQSTG